MSLARSPRQFHAITIPNGQSLSKRIDVGEWTAAAIMGSLAWTTADLMVQVGYKVPGAAQATPAHHYGAGSSEANADADDAAKAYTLGNSLKALINTHVASTMEHDRAETLITAADADSEAKAITLANDIQDVWNRHMASHPGAAGTLDASPTATAFASVYVILNAIKAAYNTHISQVWTDITWGDLYDKDGTLYVIQMASANPVAILPLADFAPFRYLKFRSCNGTVTPVAQGGDRTLYLFTRPV